MIRWHQYDVLTISEGAEPQCGEAPEPRGAGATQRPPLSTCTLSNSISITSFVWFILLSYYRVVFHLTGLFQVFQYPIQFDSIFQCFL